MRRPPSGAFDPLPSDWVNVLRASGSLDLLGPLAEFVNQQRKDGPVYPAARDVFRAFELTPFAIVRGVIVGQDPCHADGQADGLAFSVPGGVRQPPSLRNIFLELERDCGIRRPTSGSLEPWARRGILLLNTVLTVRMKAGSHRGRGWEAVTASVIRSVSDKEGPVTFFLWGKVAQSLESLIDTTRHIVIKAGDPSPLSARYFHEQAGFGRANADLVARGLDPIDWSLD